MDRASAVRGARRTLAIAFTLFTALVALLWVIPKDPGGGFWLLTLPAALLFPCCTYMVIAPETEERTAEDARTASGLLISMILGGMLIQSLVFGDRVLSGAADTMQWLTTVWRYIVIVMLVIVAILKKLGTSPSEPAFVAPASATGPSSLLQAPARPPMVARPAAMPTPAPLTRSAGTGPTAPTLYPPVSSPGRPSESRPARAPGPTPTPRSRERTATISGASFTELTTFVEVATGLSAPDSPTSLLLSATPAGLELSAAGMEIGTVTGTWHDAAPLRVQLSVRDTLHRLASLSPLPDAVSLVFRLGDQTSVEVRDDRSGRSLALPAVRG